MVADGIPDLLHYKDCLLGWHIPRVCGLANKGHIHCDKCILEPGLINPAWKLPILRLFEAGSPVFKDVWIMSFWLQ